MKKHYLSLTQHVWLALLCAGLLLNQSAWAQSIPDAQWARVGHKLDITTDGNIVTAEVLSFPPTFPGSLGQGGDRLVKYSLRGDQIWATGLLKGGFYLGGKIQGFDYEAIGRITASAASADGGVTVAGPLNLRGGTHVAVKVSRDGGAGSWQETDIFFANFNKDSPSDLVNTPDGGFIILSSATATQPNTPSIVILRRYDALKQLVWTKQIAYPGSTSPDVSLTKGTKIISTPDGGYLITGYFNSAGADSPERGWVAKLDGNGNVSWQKLVTVPPVGFPGPGDINGMSTITDAIVSTDGAGYALVGLGTAYPNINATVLVEIDGNGNARSGRAKAIDIQQATNAYITPYTGSGGKKLYAVGNTSLQSRVDPQLLLVDLAAVTVVAKRTFPGPGASSLTDIATAGDGSLVFVTDNNQVVKLIPEPVSPTPPTGGTLALTQPTYNCTTGAITFNTTGGDGSLITYTAPGITRSSPTSNTGTVEPGLRGDPKPITITAMQSGNTASYLFDFGAYCNNPPPPPVTPPTGGSLALIAPDYNCTTGAFTFKTSGGNGSTIEYQAAGITGWTTNPNQFVDKDSRTASDVQPFTLMARQNGVTVTYTWDLRAYCSSPPPPPVTPPTGSSLVLIAPTYNCATGAIIFNTTGGNGSLIEFRSVGITDWTTNPNQFVDKDSRTANDVQPFTLMARQSGIIITYVWNLKAACGRAARTSALLEPGTTLQVRVLGNPVINQTASVEITGAPLQTIQVSLVDLQGKVVHQQSIWQAESTERVSVPMGTGSGLFLLNVSTSTQHQQVKLLKP